MQRGNAPLKPDPGSSVALDALWQAPAIFWVMITGVAVAAVLALAPGVVIDRWNYFGLILLVIQWIAFITLAFLFGLRRHLSRFRPTQVAYVAVILLLANTWLIGSAAWIVIREFSPSADDGWPTLMLRLTGIALAVGVLGLAAFRNHWRSRQLALRAKQAELESLRARIRPHFLFNTLNTAAALVHQRPGEAEQILLDLADLFRAALSGPREIPLAEEIALTQRYVEIETLRFSDRLNVSWDLPDPLPATTVPTLSLQPLVENAIRHGVEQVSAPSTVEVTVAQHDGLIRITVSNDLPAEGESSQRGHRIGQASARARIEALTGDRGRLETRIENGRYIATILLPFSPVPAVLPPA